MSGLPTDGRAIFVRLRYLLDGVWQFRDYQYTADLLVPELSSPAGGTTLPGSNVTFSWTSNGAPVTGWRFYVGPSPGSTAYHYSGTLAPGVLSAEVMGLPTESQAIYARLGYLVNGAWSYQDYQYTAAHLVPELLSPTPGSALSGPDVTFGWTSNGAPVSRWLLYVGTSPGLSNLFYSGPLTSDVLSASVTGLPVDGSPIYVRLRYRVNGVWKRADYEYTAGTTP